MRIFANLKAACPLSIQRSDFCVPQTSVPRAATHLQQTSIRNVLLCKPDFVEFMLADAIAVNVQTVMFRRDLLTKSEQWFDESFVGGEDLDLFFRLARRTSLVYVNAVHALMRVHPNSLTARQSMQCMVDAAEVRRINLRRLRPVLNNKQVSRARVTVANWFIDLGYSQWRHGKRSDARAAFTAAWQVNPTTKALLSYARAFLPLWALEMFARSA